MKYFCRCIGVLFLISVPVFLEAHPPQHIDITVSDSTVTVIVQHAVDPTVSDPERHYIEKVELRLNGERVVEQYFLQQTGGTQTAIYNIPGLKKGDNISAAAFCNEYGSLQKEYVVGVPQTIRTRYIAVPNPTQSNY